MTKCSWVRLRDLSAAARLEARGLLRARRRDSGAMQEGGGSVVETGGGRRSERLATMGRAAREAQEKTRVGSGGAAEEGDRRAAVACYRALLAEVYVAIMDGVQHKRAPAGLDMERVQHNRRWLLEGWEGGPARRMTEGQAGRLGGRHWQPGLVGRCSWQRGGPWDLLKRCARGRGGARGWRAGGGHGCCGRNLGEAEGARWV